MTVLLKERDGTVLLEPALFFKDSRGTGGKEALQIAKEISRQGRKEVESQRKKLS